MISGELVCIPPLKTGYRYHKQWELTPEQSLSEAGWGCCQGRLLSIFGAMTRTCKPHILKLGIHQELLAGGLLDTGVENGQSTQQSSYLIC